MTNSTASRPPEEVIFERYWAHACAQCHGLTFVEVRAPGGGYAPQPIDTNLLSGLESMLQGGVSGTTFRRDVQAQVMQIFAAIGRLPSTAEILERIPSLADAIGEYVVRMGGGRQAA